MATLRSFSRSPSVGIDVAAAMSGDVDAFCRLLLEDDPGAETVARAFWRPLAGLQPLADRLLIPAAATLGRWWVEDEADFAAVTLGMARLQRILWLLVGRTAGALRGRAPGLLLAVAPGELHGFGLSLLHALLRERGLEAAFLPAPTEGELAAVLGAGRVQTLGLSVGCETTLLGLPRLCQVLRRAASQPLHILVGGGQAGRVAADATRFGVDEALTSGALERLCALAGVGEARPASAA